MNCQKIIGTGKLYIVDEDYTHKSLVLENIVKTISNYTKSGNETSVEQITEFIDKALETEGVEL